MFMRLSSFLLSRAPTEQGVKETDAIVVSLVALWFFGDCKIRRLPGLLAVCLATVLSVWIQFHLAAHTRPLLDPALHLKIFVDPRWRVVWDLKKRLVGFFAFFGPPRSSQSLGWFLHGTIRATSLALWS
jgi:hypothetical protein